MCFQTCLASSESFKGFWNFFVLVQVFSVAEGRFVLMVNGERQFMVLVLGFSYRLYIMAVAALFR